MEHKHIMITAVAKKIADNVLSTQIKMKSFVWVVRVQMTTFLMLHAFLVALEEIIWNLLIRQRNFVKLIVR